MTRFDLPSTAVVALAVALVVALWIPAAAQNRSAAAPTDWTPDRLPDGQPNITGMWNNSNAMFTPLELPEDLVGKDLSAEELQARAEARGRGRIAASEWKGHENSRGVGGYGTYWFDWYWEKPVDIGQAALIVDPPNGRVPERTANAASRSR